MTIEHSCQVQVVYSRNYLIDIHLIKNQVEVFVIVMFGGYSVEGNRLILVMKSKGAYGDRIELAIDAQLVFATLVKSPFVPLEIDSGVLHPDHRLPTLIDGVVELDGIVILGVLAPLEFRLEEKGIVHGGIQYIQIRYLIVRILDGRHLDERPIDRVLLVILKIDPTKRIIRDIDIRRTEIELEIMVIAHQFPSDKGIRSQRKLREEYLNDFVIYLEIKGEVLSLHDLERLIVLKPISQGIDQDLPYFGKFKFALHLTRNNIRGLQGNGSKAGGILLYIDSKVGKVIRL